MIKIKITVAPESGGMDSTLKGDKNVLFLYLGDDYMAP
jgi:hypothetical protein